MFLLVAEKLDSDKQLLRKAEIHASSGKKQLSINIKIFSLTDGQLTDSEGSNMTKQNYVRFFQKF